MLPSDTLLITGSTGFVGKSLLDFINRQANFIEMPGKIILTSRSQPEQEKQIIHARGKTQVISKAMNLLDTWTIDQEPTHILNLAADGSSTAYTEEAGVQFLKIITELISFTKKQNSRVSVLHASSGACFGQNRDNLSDNPLWNKSTFLKYRVAGESLLIDNCELYNLTIARLFSFSGKFLLYKPHYAISSFINSAVLNKEIIVRGNPNSLRSFLSADDLSEWLLRSLELMPRDYFLEIGSSEATTLGQVAEFISFQTESNITYENPQAELDNYLPRPKRTMEILGVSEKSNWRDEIAKMITEARSIHD